MIIYFSATGNSEYVAKQLSNHSEQLVSITEAMNNHEYDYDVGEGEKVGFASPTYDWTLPSIVVEFIEKLTLNYTKRPYMYYVGTYGTSTGAASSMIKRYMAQRGYVFDAYFDIKMPDTWTPIFDLSNKDKVMKINEQAKLRIQWIKNKIENNRTGKYMYFHTPYFTGVIGKNVYDHKVRYTKNLSVAKSCVGCGLCAKKCPVHAIEMKDNKPVWVKKRCVMCLGCLHRCPMFAIEYGKNTKKHGQYLHP